MKQNTHTLTDEQLTKLLANDPETVAFVRTLIDPPRVKRWEELYPINEYWVTHDGKVKSDSDLHISHRSYATEPQAIGYGIAAAKLTQVVEDARAGWEPRFDGTQDNWYVGCKEGRLYTDFDACIYRPFALPTRELAEQLLETNIEDLKAYYAAVGS
jgi:hypothetical protein